MKLSHLRAMVAIAEHGSINAAARQLCVTQPAITRTMRELEADVGVALINRNSWGITFTEHGERLLKRARLIVYEFERTVDDMAELRGVAAGTLRVGVSPLAGMTLLPQAYMLFRKFMPEVRVEFLEWSVTHLLDNLRTSRLDFALAALPQPPTDSFISSTEILRATTAFATRCDSQFAKATSFAELQDAEWWHADATDAFPQFLSEVFARHGLPPPSRITRCTSNLLTSGIVLQTDVIVPLSRFALAASPVPMLTALALPIDPPDIRLMLMTRESAMLSRPAEYFVQCIREAGVLPTQPLNALLQPAAGAAPLAKS